MRANELSICTVWKNRVYQNIKTGNDFTVVDTVSSVSSNTKHFGENYFYLASLYIMRQSTFIKNTFGVKKKKKEMDI